jgi:CelD/BcsL family acetyltransferase involved in cellulose biosynthesis
MLEIGGLGVHMVNAIAPATADWRRLETHSSSLYQSLAWCSHWLDLVGRAQGVEPLIVVGRDHTGQALFLLPFQVRRRMGCRLLEWLTMPHATYGHGLFAPGFDAVAWFRAHGNILLAALKGIDAFNLHDMPAHLRGQDHPLSFLFNMKAANLSYGTDLTPDFAAYYAAKRSGETRRTARKRDGKLATIGELDFRLPEMGTATHEVIDAMFRHQEDRLAESGVFGVFGAEERAFVHRLADETSGQGRLLLPYCLRIKGEISVVLLGGLHANTYWALISSLAPGPARKFSPGDYALRHMMEDLCGKGVAHLDFASGDTGYKLQWKDEEIPLHLCIRARSWRGLAPALFLMLRYGVKRMVKRTPALMELATAVRRLRGKSRPD